MNPLRASQLGAERERNALLIERCPVEPGPAAAWSRGEAWRGLPTATALRGLTIAGPGERVPLLPWPAVSDVAVRRGKSRLLAPGGQVVTVDLVDGAEGNLMQLGGPTARGTARLSSGEWRSPTSLTAEGTAEHGMAAATAGFRKDERSLELLGLGSRTEEASDGLLMVDGAYHPSPDLTLRSTALARRWEQEGLRVDRLSWGAELSWFRRPEFSVGSLIERHGAVGDGAVQRASLYAEGKLPVGRWLTLEGGARGVHERGEQGVRMQLAPSAQVALRPRRLGFELVGSAFGDPGVWMPEGAGVTLPATRTLQLVLYRRLWDQGDLWAGVRRTDTLGTLGPGTDAPGDLAAIGGLEWSDRGWMVDLDGAIAPSARWSTASAAMSWRVPCGRDGPRLGAVTTWRSLGASPPPPGVVMALPFTEVAHLDAGGRLGLPLVLRKQTLVLEGTLWGRLADSDPSDPRFDAVPTLPAGELAARLEW